MMIRTATVLAALAPGLGAQAYLATDSDILDAVDAFCGSGPTATLSGAPLGDISTWNIQEVTTLEELFSRGNTIIDCPYEIDIGSWNTAKVTNIEKMFFSTTESLRPLQLFVGDLSAWNVQAVDDFDDVFSNGFVITTVPPYTLNWDSITPNLFSGWCKYETGVRSGDPLAACSVTECTPTDPSDDKLECNQCECGAGNADPCTCLSCNPGAYLDSNDDSCKLCDAAAPGPLSSCVFPVCADATASECIECDDGYYLLNDNTGGCGTCAISEVQFCAAGTCTGLDTDFECTLCDAEHFLHADGTCKQCNDIAEGGIGGCRNCTYDNSNSLECTACRTLADAELAGEITSADIIAFRSANAITSSEENVDFDLYNLVSSTCYSYGAGIAGCEYGTDQPSQVCVRYINGLPLSKIDLDNDDKNCSVGSNTGSPDFDFTECYVCQDGYTVLDSGDNAGTCVACEDSVVTVPADTCTDAKTCSNRKELCYANLFKFAGQVSHLNTLTHTLNYVDFSDCVSDVFSFFPQSTSVIFDISNKTTSNAICENTGCAQSNYYSGDTVISNETSCLECPDSGVDGCIVKACDDPSDVACLGCNATTELVGGVCVPCVVDENCLNSTCAYNAGSNTVTKTCNTCDAGFANASTGNGLTLSGGGAYNVAGCVACTYDITNCPDENHACGFEADDSDGVQTTTSTCTACESNQYFLSDNTYRECLACDDGTSGIANCYECTSASNGDGTPFNLTCDSCDPSYRLDSNNNVCVDCAATDFNNCVTSDCQTCTQCQANYNYADNITINGVLTNDCYLCADTIANCVSATCGATLADHRCDDCAYGYYPNSTTAGATCETCDVPEDDFCLSWDCPAGENASDCTVCSAGYELATVESRQRCVKSEDPNSNNYCLTNLNGGVNAGNTNAAYFARCRTFYFSYVAQPGSGNNGNLTAADEYCYDSDIPTFKEDSEYSSANAEFGGCIECNTTVSYSDAFTFWSTYPVTNLEVDIGVCYACSDDLSADPTVPSNNCERAECVIDPLEDQGTANYGVFTCLECSSTHYLTSVYLDGYSCTDCLYEPAGDEKIPSCVLATCDSAGGSNTRCQECASGLFLADNECVDIEGLISYNNATNNRSIEALSDQIASLDTNNNASVAELETALRALIETNNATNNASLAELEVTLRALIETNNATNNASISDLEMQLRDLIESNNATNNASIFDLEMTLRDLIELNNATNNASISDLEMQLRDLIELNNATNNASISDLEMQLRDLIELNNATNNASISDLEMQLRDLIESNNATNNASISDLEMQLRDLIESNNATNNASISNLDNTLRGVITNLEDTLLSLIDFNNATNNASMSTLDNTLRSLIEFNNDTLRALIDRNHDENNDDISLLESTLRDLVDFNNATNNASIATLDDTLRNKIDNDLTALQTALEAEIDRLDAELAEQGATHAGQLATQEAKQQQGDEDVNNFTTGAFIIALIAVLALIAIVIYVIVLKRRENANAGDADGKDVEMSPTPPATTDAAGQPVEDFDQDDVKL